MRIEKKITIINKLGLHARAATQLVQVALKYDAKCTICNGQKQADASSVLGLMMLESHQGQEIKVICEGKDGPAMQHVCVVPVSFLLVSFFFGVHAANGASQLVLQLVCIGIQLHAAVQQHMHRH